MGIITKEVEKVPLLNSTVSQLVSRQVKKQLIPKITPEGWMSLWKSVTVSVNDTGESLQQELLEEQCSFNNIIMIRVLLVS